MFAIRRDILQSGEGLTRRAWLRVGGLGVAGLSLANLFHGRAAARARPLPVNSFGRARSCILCFLFGAPAHQDIWDLKPDAPADVRGEFRPIATSVPGLFLGEHVPQIARGAHRFALLRAVSHPDNTHTVAMHYMLTGRRHAQPNTNPRNQPSDFPCFGAAMQYLRPGRSGLPSGISLNAPANQVSANNHIFPGFFAGILGSGHDPLFVAQDPSAADFRPLPAAEGDAATRLHARRGLLATVDARRRALDRAASVGAFDAEYQRAFSLVTSARARAAFDLSQEPVRVRDRYGRNSFGQGLLLARRLVETGVGLVTVNWARDDAFWDTHANNFRDLKTKLLPPFDLGFSALLEDLANRGLLDETLVVCLGEFGRTPQINRNAGRDHWAACNSVVFAGGGVRPGRVHGASDRRAAYPATPPVSPDDLAATVYHTLGIDPETEIRDRQGRPWPLTQGRVLHELF
ncbi:MAG TPA: DUF1501 domain-containing protein [Gemmataceae bacterium]|nr:DUF1501 domain-containing protein [Gemmataceae bacterium]